MSMRSSTRSTWAEPNSIQQWSIRCVELPASQLVRGRFWPSPSFSRTWPCLVSQRCQSTSSLLRLPTMAFRASITRGSSSGKRKASRTGWQFSRIISCKLENGPEFFLRELKMTNASTALSLIYILQWAIIHWLQLGCSGCLWTLGFNPDSRLWLGNSKVTSETRITRIGRLHG